MCLRSKANFLSSAYQPINLKNIFCLAGSSVSINKKPIGLVNRRNLIILPIDFIEYGNITICFPEKTGRWVDSNILNVPFPSSLISGFVFFNMDKKYFSDLIFHESDLYVNFLKEMSLRLSDACKIIFNYTYDHLSNRYYGECRIAKIPTIQSYMAHIYIMLKKLLVSQENVFCIEDFNYFISILIKILTHLSRLGGARSILNNGSVEFIYHLKVFQKFIEDKQN